MADAYLEHADKTRTRLNRPVSLGRSSACEIALNDTECSRRHALINPQAGGEFWIVDLGSTNGTHVNGRRLLRPTQLADGDRILLGRSELTFRGGAPRAPAKARRESDTQMITRPAIRVEEAWMVLADIEGFTPFSQSHPPEEVSRRVGGWLSACAAVFAAQKADIQVYLGDGFLAYLPECIFPPARFFAAFAALRELQSDPAHLPFRLVVHHDRITVGAAAPGGIESVLGTGVNYLFRMEKVAGSVRARCAATPAALAAWPAPKPKATSTGLHVLKGFEGHHELFALA